MSTRNCVIMFLCGFPGTCARGVIHCYRFRILFSQLCCCEFLSGVPSTFVEYYIEQLFLRKFLSFALQPGICVTVSPTNIIILLYPTEMAASRFNEPFVCSRQDVTDIIAINRQTAMRSSSSILNTRHVQC